MEKSGQETSYNQKLEKVRRMPTESSIQLKEKKDKARDLRIETYLSWAQVAQRTVNLLSGNPNITLSQLETVLDSEKEKLSRPEILDSFIKVLAQKRDKSFSVLNSFRRKAGLVGDVQEMLYWPEEETYVVGKGIYRSLTKKIPKGQVRIIDTVLAVGIEVENKEDFELLDPRTNINGFYCDESSVKIGLFKKIDFPLIVVKKIPFTGTTVKHELNHAVNSAIIKTLKTRENGQAGLKNQVWGGRETGWKDLSINTPKEFDDFMQKKGIFHAYSQAKDEILADLSVRGNFNKLQSLKPRHGIYDYFDKIISFLKENKTLKISEEEAQSVCDNLWMKYQDKLASAVLPAQKTLEIYQENGLSLRRDSFPFVLAQIPLTEWRTKLISDFLKEAVDYDSSRLKAVGLRVKIAQALAGTSDISAGNTLAEKQVTRAFLEAIYELLGDFVLNAEKLARHSETDSLYPISKKLSEETKKYKVAIEKVVGEFK